MRSALLPQNNTMEAIRVVFVNGILQADDFSTVDGLTVIPVVKAIENGLLDDLSTLTGIYIAVKKNTVINKSIHLLHLQTASSSNVQSISHVIVADANSQLTIFEEYLGETDIHYSNSVVTQMTARSGSMIRHYRLQNEGSQASHLGKISVDQSANSHVDTYHFNVGAQSACHELHYRFLEKGASAKMIGLYTGHAKQQLDSHTLVDHIAPHCDSEQIYRGVLFDSSHGVFNGKIKVFPNAQKTSAFLNNRNLLLSPYAQVDTKPELEIDADDVKCAHGATVGSLDPQALFYLRSRGISEEEAKQLLIQAFLMELFEALPDVKIQSYIQSVVMNALA